MRLVDSGPLSSVQLVDFGPLTSRFSASSSRFWAPYSAFFPMNGETHKAFEVVVKKSSKGKNPKPKPARFALRLKRCNAPTATTGALRRLFSNPVYKDHYSTPCIRYQPLYPMGASGSNPVGSPGPQGLPSIGACPPRRWAFLAFHQHSGFPLGQSFLSFMAGRGFNPPQVCFAMACGGLFSTMNHNGGNQHENDDARDLGSNQAIRRCRSRAGGCPHPRFPLANTRRVKSLSQEVRRTKGHAGKRRAASDRRAVSGFQKEKGNHAH